MHSNDPTPRRAWTRWVAIALFSLTLGGCGGGDPSELPEVQRYLQYFFGDPDESPSDPADDAGKRPKGQSATSPASPVN